MKRISQYDGGLFQCATDVVDLDAAPVSLSEQVRDASNGKKRAGK